MTYDSLMNRGEYFSAHYLAEVLPKDLKSGLLAEWKQREDEAAEALKAAAEASGAEAEPAHDALPVTPRAGLRALRRRHDDVRGLFLIVARLGHDDGFDADILRVVGHHDFRHQDPDRG